MFPCEVEKQAEGVRLVSSYACVTTVVLLVDWPWASVELEL